MSDDPPPSQSSAPRSASRNSDASSIEIVVRAPVSGAPVSVQSAIVSLAPRPGSVAADRAAPEKDRTCPVCRHVFISVSSLATHLNSGRHKNEKADGSLAQLVTAHTPLRRCITCSSFHSLKQSIRHGVNCQGPSLPSTRRRSGRIQPNVVILSDGPLRPTAAGAEEKRKEEKQPLEEKRKEEKQPLEEKRKEEKQPLGGVIAASRLSRVGSRDSPMSNPRSIPSDPSIASQSSLQAQIAVSPPSLQPPVSDCHECLICLEGDGDAAGDWHVLDCSTGENKTPGICCSTTHRYHFACLLRHFTTCMNRCPLCPQTFLRLGDIEIEPRRQRNAGEDDEALLAGVLSQVARQDSLAEVHPAVDAAVAPPAVASVADIAVVAVMPPAAAPPLVPQPARQSPVPAALPSSADAAQRAAVSNGAALPSYASVAARAGSRGGHSAVPAPAIPAAAVVPPIRARAFNPPSRAVPAILNSSVRNISHAARPAPNPAMRPSVMSAQRVLRPEIPDEPVPHAGNTHRTLPMEARELWRTINEPLWIRFNNATTDADKYRALHAILDLPSCTLSKRKGGSIGAAATDTIRATLLHYLSSVDSASASVNDPAPSASVLEAARASPASAALSHRAPSPSAPPAARIAQRPENAVDGAAVPLPPSRPISRTETESILRANSIARSGYISKAVQTLLGRAAIAEADEPTIARLKDLHPPASGAMEAMPEDAPEIIIDPDSLQRCIKEMDTGSAPGRDGWSVTLLTYLFPSEQCMTGLASFLTDMLNGRITDRFLRKRLLCSRLIALLKTPTPSANVRPIAIGSVFYRVAAAYITHLVAPKGSPVFKQLQYAVGTPGGSHVSVHLLQMALELYGNDAAVLSLDVKNAFNTRKRSSIAHALYVRKDLAKCFRLFNWAYGEASPLIFDNDLLGLAPLFSQEGVRQGDPLAMLAFCASIQPLLEKISATTPPSEATVVSYADNIYLVGRASSLCTSFNASKRLLAEDGCTLTCADLFWPHSSPLPECLTQLLASNSNVTLVDSRVLPVLGGVVGLDVKAKRDWLVAEARSHARLFNRVSARQLHPSVAYRMITKSALPRMVYLLRCHSPNVTLNACKVFDDLALTAVLKVLDLPKLDDISLHQLSLPRRCGGGGCRRQANVAHAAFFAAVAQAVQHCEKLSNLIKPKVRPTDPSAWVKKPFHESLKICFRRLSDAGVPAGNCFPSAFNQLSSVFRSGAPAKLQQAYTKFIEDAAMKEALADIAFSPEEKRLHAVRMLSASGKHAGDWIDDTSGCRLSSLTPQQYRMAFRILLGVPLDRPHPCACGLSTRDVRHFMTCIKGKRRGLLQRHDLVANALKALASEAGFYSSTLPRLNTRDAQLSTIADPSESEDGKPSHKVADLRVVSGSMNAFLDVTIGYPATRAVLQSSAPLMHLASAKRAEQTKRAKYALIVENDYDAKESLRTGQHTYRPNGQKFIPFALEVNGSLGPSAVKFLKSVADHAALTGAARDRGDFLKYAYQVVSVTLQRGNAMVLTHQLTDAATRMVQQREAAGRPVRGEGGHLEDLAAG